MGSFAAHMSRTAFRGAILSAFSPVFRFLHACFHAPLSFPDPRILPPTGKGGSDNAHLINQLENLVDPLHLRFIKEPQIF